MKLKISIMKISRFNAYFLYIFCFLFVTLTCFGQFNSSSPANWLYPEGNYSATKYISSRSDKQSLDSFIVKWSSTNISGDVKPLIGNIINNSKLLPSFKWAPNEITAVIGDELIIINAAGRTHKKTSLPPFIKNVSVLFDTLAPVIDEFVSSPVALGLETIEIENRKDSLSFAYIGGFNHNADTLSLLKRLAIDLRGFKPNLFASVKPVLGRRFGSNFLVYATVNMTKPDTAESSDYFRGLAQFNTGTEIFTFPLPDVGDDEQSRVTLAPIVNISQPSFGYPDFSPSLLLPCFPDKDLSRWVNNNITNPTKADNSYLFSFSFSGANISAPFQPVLMNPIFDTSSRRTQLRPYYINVKDKSGSDSLFILVAEEYLGLDGSQGISRLHLYDIYGAPLTNPGNQFSPPFVGGENHLWSVAIGDLDGNNNNESLPYFPNNPGKEIIVSQSSREYAYPGSKLMVLRYDSGQQLQKPSPPNSFLYAFDTIATKQINGWVAAVNDIDGADDGKDEIIIVNGSNLLVLRMRDYTEFDFQIGNPFDTVFSAVFPNETISSVAVADLEGDGKNDIIVVTYDSLYVIGSLIGNTLDVISPVTHTIPPKSFCAGDTIEIVWKNIIRGQNRVNLLFREYLGTNPSGNTYIVRNSIQNDGDTIRYLYIVDSLVLGKQGRFILVSEQESSIKDSTSIMRFNNPSIDAEPLSRYTYRAGSWLSIRGTASCIDTVIAAVSFNGNDWFPLDNQSLIYSDKYNYVISGQLPCPDFYSCSGPDTSRIVYVGVVGYRGDYSDSFELGAIKMIPAAFPLYFDENETACPSMLFNWFYTAMPFHCDTVSVSYSIDGGKSFLLMERLPAAVGEFLWQIPLELPNELILRFCCENSCIRTDTLISNYKPRYISIVSPNPFKPPYETLEVVYKVPEDVNVTLRIYDAANRLVAEPVKAQHRMEGIAYCDKWNGEKTNGTIAANGIYYLSLEMSNGVREIYHIYIRN